MAVPSRNPWRRAPTNLGRVSALQSMKLLRSRETAMDGTMGGAADAEGGEMVGADTARERADSVDIAATAWESRRLGRDAAVALGLALIPS